MQVVQVMRHGKAVKFKLPDAKPNVTDEMLNKANKKANGSIKNERTLKLCVIQPSTNYKREQDEYFSSTSEGLRIMRASMVSRR